MARWETVAEGTSLWDLEATVADMNLQKGDRMKIIMDLKLPVGFIFDAAGAELLFKPFVPDGMDLIDVYGEGSQGIVELEADPVWLLAALAFIKAHWVAITIAGFLLTALVASIIVLVKLTGVAPAELVKIIVPAAIVAGAIVLGVLVYKGRSP